MIRIGKEEIKVSLFGNDKIIYIETEENEQIGVANKRVKGIARYKINFKN